MTNFGTKTDHFDLADEGGLSLSTSTVRPEANTRVDSPDENGDIADSKYVGNKNGTIKDIECEYTLAGDCEGGASLDLSTISLGMLADASIAIISVEVETSNSGWPTVKVTGKSGVECVDQSKTFELPAITIQGLRKAQPLGVEVGTGKLSSTSLSASADWTSETDGSGEQIAWAITAGVATSSGTAVATSTAAPTLTAASGWEVSQALGVEEPKAEWHTATLDVEKVLTATVPAPGNGGGGGD